MRGSYTFVEVERSEGGGGGGGGRGGQENEQEGEEEENGISSSINDARRKMKNPRARPVGDEFEVEIGEFGLDERDASPPLPGTM